MIRPRAHYAILILLAVGGPTAIVKLQGTAWLYLPALAMSGMVAAAFGAAIRLVSERKQLGGIDMTMSTVTATAAELAPIVAIWTAPGTSAWVLIAARFFFLILQLAEIGRFHQQHAPRNI